MNVRRAGTIYVKELVDILRDHRTLTAMIVAPIILYPLLMLGGIQAASTQSKGIEDEKITVGFEHEWQWERVIKPMLVEERRIIERMRSRAVAKEVADEIPEPLGEHVVPKWIGNIEDGVLQHLVHCGVSLPDSAEDEGANAIFTAVTIVVQSDEVRSQIAGKRLAQALERVGLDRRDKSLRRLRVDPRLIDPIGIEYKRLATPGSVLGLILPFILVLMTVTGAIYPAIDLTAGERERGTLESLMVCPVPTIDLIVGKFMAVTTIALIAAALNIASVTATVMFGGLQDVLARDASGESHGFPYWALPVVLFTLVPFAVLMSAIMIAVCAFARTFKEAQNYIMPVIMLVLVPGGIAALPGTKLEGVMIVMPVANMVLLTRELLSGVSIAGATFATVLVSTSFYAAVAVAIAAQVFGKESVLFADSVSFRTLISRRLIRPRRFPSLSGAGLYAAVLFPFWFYVQSAMQSAGEDSTVSVLRWTAIWMPVFFVFVPLAIALYWKLDVGDTFRLGPFRARAIVGAVLLGLTAWVPAHELVVLQDWLVPTPAGLADSNKALAAALASMSPVLAFCVIALVPALCEEFFFRGFLLSGLRTSFGKWAAILCGAAAFGAFHYFIFRFPVTASLGVLLGWVCWQSRSIWPAVVVHALHNGTAVLLAVRPSIASWMGLPESETATHLPMHVVLPAIAVLGLGILLLRSIPDSATE